MRLVLLLMFLYLYLFLSAQDFHINRSNLQVLKDSTVKKSLTAPQKATLLSAIIPGSGQIYNAKYLKAGIVYGGAIALAYTFKVNTDSLKVYQRAYTKRIDGDSTTIDTNYPLLSDAAVKANRDFHRRFRDMSILGMVGLYALQIIDANVDAHLREFDLNEDLSLMVRPSILPAYYEPASFYGLKLCLRF